MEQLNNITSTLALTMGAAWASGINLYAAILTLGLMGATGNIQLPPGLEILTDPMVLMAAGVMYFIEFFADKVPGVDTAWDGLHTFVRIPAGAMLAAAAVGDMNPAVELAAALMGGGLAAATHATKAGSRALINSSPEPFSNWTASISEDVAVIVGLWTALNHPVLFLVLLGLFILAMIWLLPRLWRGLKLVWRKVRGALAGGAKPPEVQSATQTAAPEPVVSEQAVSEKTVSGSERHHGA